MIRAIVHVGLAAALVFVPTLCCCKVGLLAKPAQATHASAPVTTVTIPVQVPLVESCCQKAKKTCCDTATHHQTPTEKPKPAHAPECACCAERPDPAPPEGTITETAPRPTGELLSLELAGLLAYAERAGAVHGFHPPDGAGVDARYAKLFERHVLRC